MPLSMGPNQCQRLAPATAAAAHSAVGEERHALAMIAVQLSKKAACPCWCSQWHRPRGRQGPLPWVRRYGKATQPLHQLITAPLLYT